MFFSSNRLPLLTASTFFFPSPFLIYFYHLQKKGRFSQFSLMYHESRDVVGGLTYRHHIVALHVRLVLVLALIIELSEEVEGHHGVEVDDHGQQTHRQHELGGDRGF